MKENAWHYVHVQTRLRNVFRCDGKKSSSVFKAYWKAVVRAVIRLPIIDLTLKFVRDEDAP